MTATLPKMSEAELQAAVVELAHMTGWEVAHFRPARVKRDGDEDGWVTPVAYNGKGWPDLVLVRDRVVYAELKSSRAKLRPDQERWRDRLHVAGAEWHLWRPDDWHTGRIDAVLARTPVQPIDRDPAEAR